MCSVEDEIASFSRNWLFQFDYPQSQALTPLPPVHGATMVPERGGERGRGGREEKEKGV